jgi:hypothetical protein
MRLNEPIEYSSLPRVLGLSIGVIAVATAVIAVIDLVSN